MSYSFESYELKTENGELQVVLHIKAPKNSVSTEFGSDFNLDEADTLKSSAINYVKKHFPKLKVASIVVIAGTMLLTSFPMHKAEAHEADFNMSYLYFGNTSSYITQVDKTQGNLNLVSPSYLDINADGSLKVTAQFDTRFVAEMHKRDIKVVPFLSNHWDRALGRAALANRDKLSTQIADFIIKNNLDGLQVDIENTTDIDRAAYTDLIRLLREKLPAEKEVSVAVAANPNGWTKGWHGSYDYNELAKYSSYIMIMAYDESYEGSEQGPVASIGFVERSIKYALNQGVPKEKIVLGVPFYGRYWKEGATSGGTGISNTRVDELLAKYGGTVEFDEASKSPKATITIKSGDPTTTIAGRTLSPGTYHVWYENNDSIREKLRLVHKYGIKGTGSWSLGQENASMWQFYRTWMSHDGVEVAPVDPTGLKEQTGVVSPIPSIPYTVQSGDTLWKIANAHKMTVNEIKVLNGFTSDNIYAGQIIKVNNPVPNLLTEQASQQEGTSKNPFKDINKYSVEEQQNILNLVEQNIIKGKSATTFAPSEAITRGQVVVMLGRLLVSNGYAKVPVDWETNAYFKDLPVQTEDRELLKYAAVVKSSGVFKGKTDGTLDSSGTFTREGMALVLNRATEAISGQTLVDKAKGKEGFVADLPQATTEAQEAIQALNALGISNVEKFDPKGEVQRVHFASFLSRGMKFMVPDQ